jgi:hypothetical protein
MGWEIRGGRRYFTRSRKVHGKVVRQYVGGGGLGELVAAADALRRAEAAAHQAEQARWEAALIPLLELCRVTDLLTHACLLANGFHQHARSSWRKKRDVRDKRDVRGRDLQCADAAGGPVDKGATG